MIPMEGQDDIVKQRRSTMFAKLVVLAGAAVAGAAWAAMPAPIMTSSFSPLVDGARYDYAFTMGPRTTATVVMHSGQIWACVPQRTSMHTTSTCRTAGGCAQ